MNIIQSDENYRVVTKTRGDYTSGVWPISNGPTPFLFKIELKTKPYVGIMRFVYHICE